MKHRNEYLGRVMGNDEVTYWIEHNLENYLRKNPEDQGEIEHILDYLVSDAAPSRLRSMSYEQAKRGAEKWVAALTKKGNDICETEQDVEVVTECACGNLRWVKLLSKRAYLREGRLMRHCVGSYYGKPVSIYSLRDRQNQPHCTIEVDEGVQQVKGRGNGSIHPKYVSAVLEFVQQFGTIRSSELRYMGYIELPDVAWELIERRYTNIPTITYGGKRYLYIHKEPT